MLCVLGLLAPGSATATGTGSFGPTGSMGTPRYGAVAAPLPDGRVLVAGGRSEDSAGALSSAEIFDPATGRFSGGIGSMNTPRFGAVAAPLADGHVLIAGGFDGMNSLSSAEVFNPASGSFSGVSPMSTLSSVIAAAPLQDGRVLVTGASDGSPNQVNAEVYDPRGNAWTPIGHLPGAFGGMTAAPLRDGRVLFAGGVVVLQVGGSTDISYLNAASIFAPATASVTAASPMITRRADAASAALPDGRVLVAGGVSALNLAEVFDLAANAWSPVGAMSTGRSSPVAARLPDGRVLVAGGEDRDHIPLASAEIYAASNDFTFGVNGRRLLVSVQASGQVSVSDAASPLSASTSKKKRKKRPLLKPVSASGDPPTIAVRLALTKAAKKRLKRKGKVTVNARVTFKPEGGAARTQTAKLKIMGKKRK